MKKYCVILLMVFFGWSQSFGLNIGLGFASIEGLTAKDKDGNETSAIDPGLHIGLISSFDLALIDLDIGANFNIMKYKDFDESALVIMSIPATVRLTILPLAVAKVYLRGGVQYESILTNKLSEDLEFDDAEKGMAFVVGAGAAVEAPEVGSLLVELIFSLPQYDAYEDFTGEGRQVVQGALRASILF